MKLTGNVSASRHAQVLRQLEETTTQLHILELEKVLLLNDINEALELLQRGFELADEIGLDVGWQMDVDVFIGEHAGYEKEEKEEK